MITLGNTKLAIIGLGYVGLPLAVEFAKKYPVIGFDINTSRITELKSGKDTTLELTSDELTQTGQLQYTSNVDDLKSCNVYIVTVPTPVDKHKNPDLSPLIKASEMIGELISLGDIVIYESTVYPGATEEMCIPAIEQSSGLTFNQDFYAGYSPERINPGDKKHRVINILKVTSGSTPEVADYVDDLYQSIIIAGTHKASSIKVAEASKVIENTQRDVNIALMNELSHIFSRLDIDTEDVLKAAGTKWNFLPFRPGLVGGHCIGIDPYYLVHKAQEVGYNPEIIRASRRINDSMGNHIVNDMIRLMLKKRIHISESKILIMGLTFKENCPDLRNTRVIDMIAELHTYGAIVDVYDPWADSQEADKEYQLKLINELKNEQYDAILLAVAHEEFATMGAEKIHQLGKASHVLYDIKHLLKKHEVDGRL
ncbi:Vi polysaccharide biosynthesis UDP-N-acetylglucosamine C-6 dehydrogenase TviB [sulfur-oxidizing endosymbiont of Gigantopelta aegis]|uniref:Vi polysaccharide biosynthesis UDP-N-acetylglucosamine C-6 dehydrogenase TviB n=1 Tax=sulfur-oxidizing endosymbiont of Gigantopelta aegis TaxID=2794934 RepID=UPI0018DEB021|nr:Vi polysaccharide biosynthesis UDP-N-acetylglucosamine C-6 dehydrogenase TviB [sulfur-oxidizing endosymbiont of Gigantopelta aegis]